MAGFIQCNYGGGGGPVALWTNPSPSASFANQTVSVDLSDYDAVLILVKHGTAQSADVSYDMYHGVIYLPVGVTGAYISAPSQANYRSVNVTTSGVQFVTTSAAAASIPCKIWGVKGITLT